MKNMNRREDKKIAVMAAIIMGLMMFAFMPAASATVTSFTVTPSTGIAGAVDSYNALVTTDGVTSINITIPQGFIAVVPMSGGVQIASVDFWNSSTKAYYGNATITSNIANPTTQVDIHCEFGGATATTTQPVNYNPGATNTFVSNVGGDTSSAIIKLPTETVDGSINITINCTAFYLDDVMIASKQFVRNPLTAGGYDFFADGVKETVTITAPPGGHCTVFRNAYWYVDSNGDSIADIFFRYGLAGDTPIVGDINRDGSKDTAVIRNVAGTPTWFVDTTGNRAADLIFAYGLVGDLFVVGDIDQDGLDDIAAIRNVGGQMTWFVDTTGNHVANLFKAYGLPGDSFVVGDVTRDGLDDKVAIRVNACGKMTWYVDTTGNWLANLFKEYGLPGDKFLVGNIDMKDGPDVAVFRGRTWIVDTTGNWLANLFYNYGLVGDTPLTGDIS